MAEEDATTVADPLMRNLDIREKLAHIDQMLADHDRKRQEITFAPWQIAVTTIGGAAALFAAGAAFVKLFG